MPFNRKDRSIIKITIPLEPVPWSVGRTTTKNGKTWAYYNEPYKSYREALQWYFRAQGADPIMKPSGIRLDVAFYLTEPKRSKYDKPIGPPDRSNLLKGLEDAAKGILWQDDSMVLSGETGKQWAQKGYIEMEVEEDEA